MKQLKFGEECILMTFLQQPLIKEFWNNFINSSCSYLACLSFFLKNILALKLSNLIFIMETQMTAQCSNFLSPKTELVHDCYEKTYSTFRAIGEKRLSERIHGKLDISKEVEMALWKDQQPGSNFWLAKSLLIKERL